MKQIATFHTHFGAMAFFRKMEQRGDMEAKMSPVPRQLSSSCGTCVRFTMAFDREDATEDMEAVYRSEGEKWVEIFRQEE